MAYYRLYFLNSDNRILRSQPFDSETDLDAEAAARHHVGDLAIELWDKDRRIIRFEAVLRPAET
jgi:hypothetical protein